MNASAKLCQIQRQRVQKQSGEMSSFEFFNLLTAPELFDVLEAHLPEHRERQYPPTETQSMFLYQAMSADRSCQNAVNNREVRRTFGGMPRGNTYTGSYCKARRRLPTELVKELALHRGEIAGETLPKNWLWKGRSVKLIDGTTVTMPDTEKNHAFYPQQRSQQPGLGFPICRVLRCRGLVLHLTSERSQLEDVIMAFTRVSQLPILVCILSSCALTYGSRFSEVKPASGLALVYVCRMFTISGAAMSAKPVVVVDGTEYRSIKIGG